MLFIVLISVYVLLKKTCKRVEYNCNGLSNLFSYKIVLKIKIIEKFVNDERGFFILYQIVVNFLLNQDGIWVVCPSGSFCSHSNNISFEPQQHNTEITIKLFKFLPKR